MMYECGVKFQVEGNPSKECRDAIQLAIAKTLWEYGHVGTVKLHNIGHYNIDFNKIWDSIKQTSLW